MASMYQDHGAQDGRKADGRKASSLTTEAHDGTGGSASGKGKRGASAKERETHGLMSERGNNPGHALVVDVILIVLVIALAVGIWFGYRAIKEAYAPEWDTREVVLCVALDGLDRATVEELMPSLENSGLWYSDSTEGERLGTVSGVWVDPPAPAEEGAVTPDGPVTLYVTVQTYALYREGKGYYVSDTQLLAGSEGVFRLRGLVANGTLVSLHERTADPETAPDAVISAENAVPEGRDE